MENVQTEKNQTKQHSTFLENYETEKQLCFGNQYKTLEACLTCAVCVLCLKEQVRRSANAGRD